MWVLPISFCNKYKNVLVVSQLELDQQLDFSMADFYLQTNQGEECVGKTDNQIPQVKHGAVLNPPVKEPRRSSPAQMEVLCEGSGRLAV